MKKPILASGLLAGLVTAAAAGDDLNSRFTNAFNDTSGASEAASPSVVAVVVPKPRLRPVHKPEPLPSDPIAKPQPGLPPIPVARPTNVP
jgi:hypothetical protein